MEFGASFGISALWLGAAARQTKGRVVTTEVEPHKAAVARQNIADAGLDDVVTLLAGNALVTLAGLHRAQGGLRDRRRGPRLLLG